MNKRMGRVDKSHIEDSSLALTLADDPLLVVFFSICSKIHTTKKKHQTNKI